MECSQNRPSGISRLSKLPVPTSSPKTVKSQTASDLRPLRQKPSYGFLSGHTSASQPPKLRTCISHSQLRSGTASKPHGVASTPRATPSRASLRTSTVAPSPISSKPVLHSPETTTPTGTYNDQSSSNYAASNSGGKVLDDGQLDVQIPERTLEAGGSLRAIQATSKTLKPRLSFTSRTGRHLSHNPSSPGLRTKSSPSHDLVEPRSEFDIDASHGYTARGLSEADNALLLVAGGRTASSEPNLTSVSAKVVCRSKIRKTEYEGGELSPNKLLPSDSALKSAQSSPASSNSVTFTPSIARARSPQSETTEATSEELFTQQPRDALLHNETQSRERLDGNLFKKNPSTVQRISSKHPVPPKAFPPAESQERGSFQVKNTRGLPRLFVPKKVASDADGPEVANRKTSAALREQIAKAKAKRREELRQSSATSHTENGGACPGSDDEDVSQPCDPFNQRKPKEFDHSELRKRIASARTSGRLNIAALRLRSIPREVLDMHSSPTAGLLDCNWAENVDLTRLVAADNEIEALDEAGFPDLDPGLVRDLGSGEGSIFWGLESFDLHGNSLSSLPAGFRHLVHLTILNLVSSCHGSLKFHRQANIVQSSNNLDNSCLSIISELHALRELRLANNQLIGQLNASVASLRSLQLLDLHDNSLSAFPDHLDELSSLRSLNLDGNKFESLPFHSLARMPLVQLSSRKNKLSGTLLPGNVAWSFPSLQTLDLSYNQLQVLVSSGSSISLPAVQTVVLSMNRISELPDLTGWTNLITLALDENNVTNIPLGLTGLNRLLHVDFANNDLRVVPSEVAGMTNLRSMRLEGNPLRERRMIRASIDELKEALANKFDTQPMHHIRDEPVLRSANTLPSSGAHSTHSLSPRFAAGFGQALEDDADSEAEEEFATPPTSARQSPIRCRSQATSDFRRSSQSFPKTIWPVKSGGLLDRSRDDLTSLCSGMCEAIAAEQHVREIQLHHNCFTSIPSSLSHFAATLTACSLAHNQLASYMLLSERLELPVLHELNLASNHIANLDALGENLRAPALQKIDVSLNRLTCLPVRLADAFPRLEVLLAPNNQLSSLEPSSIAGLRIVDASGNNIAQLDPRIGLLGGKGGLQRLDVTGNRFKVPRWSILEQGTEVTLSWLRSRVSADELVQWRSDNSEELAPEH